MPRSFYDDLSPFYHLIFEDWEASIARQGEILDETIRSQWNGAVREVLDVSCGIGTQAIALAQRGYILTASDLSPGEIQRAQKEAASRGLTIDFSVADMRHADAHHGRTFDLVISADNSLPHLLSDEEILTALKSWHRCLKPGGGCLITLRDYDAEPREGVQLKPYGVRVVDGQRYLVFQTWEFEGEIYRLAMVFICDDGSDTPETKVFRAKYYAVGVERVLELMRQAGFQDARRVESRFYQPVLVGTRGGDGGDELA